MILIFFLEVAQYLKTKIEKSILNLKVHENFKYIMKTYKYVYFLFLNIKYK